MEQPLRDEITRFVQESPENRFPECDAPYFQAPLVAFAAADDHLFLDYKRIIGEFHQTPQEILPGAASVICWSLPVPEATRRSNGRERELPSREWALTRNDGEKFNDALRRHVVALLEGKGHRAAAPLLEPGWRTVTDAPVGLASTWSERHAAYAAGLGTFSLNDALITAHGIAHRLGSVITTLSLTPTPRSAPDHRHHCLHYREGSCGACIARCPVGAISQQGHDKELCRQYSYGFVQQTVGEKYGVAIAGCGLCQTRVPCEAMVPKGK